MKTTPFEQERARREYGFTNDPVWLERTRAWRDAAVADGWSIEPTYNTESVERASSLRKDGFHALILTRDGKTGNYTYEAHVSLWGPDGLSIDPPNIYDWPTIQSGLRKCNSCGATDVATERYSFAGRACVNCIPKLKAVHEKPGWDN